MDWLKERFGEPTTFLGVGVLMLAAPEILAEYVPEWTGPVGYVGAFAFIVIGIIMREAGNRK